MIILSWNCRGFGHPTAISFLYELVRVRRPDVLFLCETHLNKIDEIKACFHYDCAFTMNCMGRSGGLCVFWYNFSLCNINSYSQNHIDKTVNDTNGPWRVMGYYGHPETSKRRLSWNLLRQLANINTLPWVCIGDYDDLLTSSKRRGETYDLARCIGVLEKWFSIATSMM